MKRKAPDASDEGVEGGHEDEDAEELGYNSLQRLCTDALKLNTSNEAGEQAFLGHACTVVEALGLCFDDCYDESSRLPGAPNFEQRVVIVMKVMLELVIAPCNMLWQQSVCAALSLYVSVCLLTLHAQPVIFAITNCVES